MTIKSEDKKDKKKVCETVKNFFKEHSDWLKYVLTIFALFGFVFVFVYGVINLIKQPSTLDEEALAKALVRADYPDVLCMSTKGAFRTYESGTYNIGIKEPGWNIWVEPYKKGVGAFHLAKCEIK